MLYGLDETATEKKVAAKTNVRMMTTIKPPLSILAMIFCLVGHLWCAPQEQPSTPAPKPTPKPKPKPTPELQDWVEWRGGRSGQNSEDLDLFKGLDLMAPRWPGAFRLRQKTNIWRPLFGDNQRQSIADGSMWETPPFEGNTGPNGNEGKATKRPSHEIDPNRFDFIPLTPDLQRFEIPPPPEKVGSQDRPTIWDAGEKSVRTMQSGDTGQRRLFISSGWESADVYKGIDKTSEAGFPTSGDPSGNNVHRTPIWYLKLGGNYQTTAQGFGGALTYLQSMDRIRPRYTSNSALLADKKLPHARFYDELDIGLNYNHILPLGLEGTIGYNGFIPLDKDFWGTNYSGELYAVLAETQIPGLRPSVTYSQFHSTVEQLAGGFIDIRLEAIGWRIYERDDVRAEFNPYISVGIDNGLINDNLDWSAWNIGARMPIQLSKRWSLTFDLNYGLPINGSITNFRTDLSKVGVWGGAALTFKF